MDAELDRIVNSAINTLEREIRFREQAFENYQTDLARTLSKAAILNEDLNRANKELTELREALIVLRKRDRTNPPDPAEKQ